MPATLTILKQTLLLLLVIFIPLSAQQNLYKEIPVTITKDAAVHIKPNDYTERVGQVKKGQKFDLLKEENNFYQIKLPEGTVGWVRNWYAEIPRVKNDVRVTGRLMTEPNIRSKIIIELRLNASAMLLVDQGKWKRVRLADGREGWITHVRAVNAGISYTQRAGRLMKQHNSVSGQVRWVEQGEAYVAKERRDNWYRIVLDDGSRGWMENPHLPAALIAMNDVKLSLTDDVRWPKGPAVAKGSMVEPLDYFKNKYMVRTTDGQVGFQMRGNFMVYEPEQMSIVRQTPVYNKKDRNAQVLATIPAMSNVPLLEKDGTWARIDAGGGITGWIQSEKAAEAGAGDGWMYVAADGKLLADSDSRAGIVGDVKKGQKFKKESIYGQYYEVTMEDGREGWLPTHLVKPSAAEITIMIHDAALVSDMKSQEGKNRIVGSVAMWDTVTQIEKAEQRVKIRTKDGLTGWVNQRWVRPDGQVKEGSIPALYHLMWWLYTWYQDTGFWGSLIYYAIIILFMCIPFFLGYLGAYGIAKIRFLPNLPVKLAGSIVIFIIAISFEGNMNWYWSYPPFHFNPDLKMLGLILGNIIFIAHFWNLIYRHRCRYCHKMWTVEITDVQHLGTVHSTETTTYTDGSKSKRRWTTKNYLVTYHCVDCDKSWTMEETYSSGGHN